MKHLRSLAILLGIVIGATFFVTSGTANAASGTCYFSGGSCNTNDTKGNSYQYGNYGVNDVFRTGSGRDTSGNGSAMASVTDKASLISFMRYYFNNGNTQNQQGAYFSVASMLGSDWQFDGYDLQRWTDRMDNSFVSVTVVPGSPCSLGLPTSYYDMNKQEDFYSWKTTCYTRPLVEVYNNQTNQIYAYFEQACGNMLGNPLPLPREWSITPHITAASNAHPQPNQTTTWRYWAHNNGPGKTDNWVELNEDRASSSSGSNFIGGNQSNWIGPGWGAYTSTSNYYDSWTPAEGDDGKTQCARSAVDPQASYDGSWTWTSWSCATAWQAWSAYPITSVGYTTLKPGTTVQWTHTAKNLGPNQTAYPINYTVGQSPGTPNTIVGTITNNNSPIRSGWQGSNGWNSTTTNPANIYLTQNTYTIQPSDAGKTLCQWITFTNSASRSNPGESKNNGNQATSSNGQHNSTNCVTIPYDYGLTPHINAPTQLDSGQQATVISNIISTGSTDSQPTNWTITQLVYSPGANPVRTGGDSTSNPCAFFSSGAPTCTQLASGGPMVISPLGYSPPQQNPTLTYPVGTVICYALSINPYFQSTPTSNTWRHSDLACVTIAKHPKLQITGGDVRTNSDIDTSQVNIGGTYYGSWVEYGAFADGRNQGPRFGSGATLRNGSTTPASGPYAVNPLTFANSNLVVPQNGPYGQFNALPASQSLYSFINGNGLGIGAASPNVIGNLATMDGDYTAGNLTISGNNTIPAGHTIQIRSSGTVTITGDIHYASASGSISNYPQLIITAKNINIASGVKLVDAWLLTSGQIDTCSDVADGNANASSSCNDNQLVINGPVEAAKGHFKRTNGSDSPATDANPAEWMNLPSSAYLWEYGQASSHIPLMTVQVTQLPPRY